MGAYFRNIPHKGKASALLFSIIPGWIQWRKEKKELGISFLECFFACRGQIQLDNRALRYTKKILVVFYVRVTLASARRV
jgi:hypothetical protein